MDGLGRLPTVYARNCDARRIGKASAGAFLDLHHSMGNAGARYFYSLENEGVTVAVASFSNSRRMRDGSRSYEWIRYASLGGIRVVGGMGKLLEAFVRDVRPDDVVTYVDESRSDGSAYMALGFTPEGRVERPGYSDLKFRKTFSTSP